ncbi:DUF501 domain-containing protein [Euzebya tangerina]|uniref:DUF501 domain-containing protein n=1 Tax=Euzebya tangerina TaxID=591198 RepID=UPI0013C2F917|nr:DUF501 domain-containing protein [Euzebya tangerina]
MNAASPVPDPEGLPDALTLASDAGYESQAARPAIDADDAAVAAAMIGRPLRGRSAAAVRCGWGLPAVLRVDPVLETGAPFPTVFWLACPLANSRIGTLEGTGAMETLRERVADPEEWRDSYRQAGERYVAFRNGLGERVPGDPAAGGLPERVKCLHSLYGHHLATDDNPVGAWVAERLEPLHCPTPCVDVSPSTDG